MSTLLFLIEIMGVHQFLQYVAAIDIVSLSQTCSWMHKLTGSYDEIVDAFRNNLKHLISKYGFIGIEDFDNFLANGQFVLSGSTMLQALSGSNWNSDLDLYSIANYNDHHQSWRLNIIMRDRGFIMSKNYIAYGQFHGRSFTHEDNDDVKIDVLWPGCETILYGIDNFDFSFVKNWYNPMEKKRVVIRSLDNVLRRYDHYENMDLPFSWSCTRCSSCWFRMEFSYRTPICKCESPNPVELSLFSHKVVNRILKYHIRGYTIVLPDYISMRPQLKITK